MKAATATTCRRLLLSRYHPSLTSTTAITTPQTTRSMATWPKIRPVRIKLITMDVTGTIVSFRGTLEEHYVGAALKCGLDRDYLRQLDLKTNISKAFSQAYNECCLQYPCFGGSQLSAKDWWKLCVSRSFEIAGVAMEEHEKEQVFQRIYSTFGSHAAYESFADAKPFLAWANRHRLVTGVLSHADERYGDSILPMLDITLDEVQFTCFSKDYMMEKPDTRFFRAAIQASVPWLLAQQGNQQLSNQQYMSSSGNGGSSGNALDIDKICHPSEVLHIGNDFTKDFEGARQAGMHFVLLDRYGEDEKAAEWKRRGAPVFKDLLDVVEFIGRSNCRLG